MKDPHIFFLLFHTFNLHKGKGPFFKMPFVFLFSPWIHIKECVSHMNSIKSLFIPSTPKGKLQFAPFFYVKIKDLSTLWERFLSNYFVLNCSKYGNL